MSKLKDELKKIWQTKPLRDKILFTALIFLVFRFLAHVPVPGVDLVRLKAIFYDSQFLSLLNVFSGGTLANFSIVAVGINPYITASIIMQLAGIVFPKIKEIQKDGESGKERINQYTRLLSLPLAVMQSISVLLIMQSQQLVSSLEPIALVTLIATLTAGAMVLMWLGELVSLYGLGNGISMILLGGILSQLPTAAVQLFSSTTSDQWLNVGIFGAVLILIIGMIVFMNEAVRKVTIQYAKRQRGTQDYGRYQTHLPIRVNVSGVMPIIFSLSIMLAPAFIARLLTASANADLINFGQKLTLWFAPTSWVYILIYFLVVFVFAFVAAMIFFNVEDISSELKKSGAFIIGIRPGAPTRKYLEYVVNRITVASAFFLGFVAILPSLFQKISGIGSLALGGTSALIVVSVILETAKKVDSMLVEQNYDQYR